jgi:hypothetical protein
MLSYLRTIDPNREVEDEGVFKAEQWTSFGGLRYGGERARARRSGGSNGGSVSPCRSRMREGEEMGAAPVRRGGLEGPVD